ncbi:MAG: hypothetical protein V3U69_07055, partial [Bacteroidota bacterium]
VESLDGSADARLELDRETSVVQDMAAAFDTSAITRRCLLPQKLGVDSVLTVYANEGLLVCNQPRHNFHHTERVLVWFF